MKSELRAEIKALRIQMAKMEANSQEREDKLMRLMLILEPFFNALTPEMHKKVMDEFDDKDFSI
jgi:hypothetical protein